ncbi:MAG: acetyl-CoA carboxylase biotin carboxylase subunit, partial [Acidobacteriota bacterium]
MVTGVDLVQWQIRIARGERLTIDAEAALTPAGHAIECRIYAEDPDQGFLPSPGLIRGLRPAAGPGIRDDGGVSAGYEVPMFYDSLIAKLVAWAPSRGEAIHRMSRALAEYHVLGIRTTIPFFLWLMRQPDYVAAEYDTTYLDRLLAARAAAPDAARFSDLPECDEDLVAVAAAVDAWLRSGIREDVAAPGAAARWTSVARREALRG